MRCTGSPFSRPEIHLIQQTPPRCNRFSVPWRSLWPEDQDPLLLFSYFTRRRHKRTPLILRFDSTDSGCCLGSFIFQSYKQHVITPWVVSASPLEYSSNLHVDCIDKSEMLRVRSSQVESGQSSVRLSPLFSGAAPCLRLRRRIRRLHSDANRSVLLTRRLCRQSRNCSRLQGCALTGTGPWLLLSGLQRQTGVPSSVTPVFCGGRSLGMKWHVDSHSLQQTRELTRKAVSFFSTQSKNHNHQLCHRKRSFSGGLGSVNDAHTYTHVRARARTHTHTHTHYW